MEDLIGLKQETLSAVMNYLTQRPYNEVHQLVREIESTATVIKVAEDEGAEDE